MKQEEIEKITRLEVIDVSKGRMFSNYMKNQKLEFSVQDEGRTLKIFIHPLLSKYKSE